MSRILDVYLHDVHAGKFKQDDAGQLSFIYDDKYVEEDRLGLSLSMPVSDEIHEGASVKTFFSGLLPDDIVRQRLGKYLGVSEENPFALLAEIGGECAGAVSLYPEGVTPPQKSDGDYEVLDDESLKGVLDILERRPLLVGDDGLRLSLAGAQNKIAVALVEDKIAIVRGTSPTTHILKPAISDIEDTAHNELFCMRLAQKVGIDAPNTIIGNVNGNTYFLIERYDREIDGKGNVARLHQEDFCQALGVAPEFKYEREGGPNIAACQDVLKKYSSQPAADNDALLNRIVFNYVIGNADAHSKNFSLLYKGERPELAPAYDLMSTAVYPELSSKMAMKIGGKYNPGDVCLRHWHGLVPDSATSKKSLNKKLLGLSKSCVEKSEELKETLVQEGITSPVFDRICEVIKDRTDSIKDHVLMPELLSANEGESDSVLSSKLSERDANGR